MLTRRSLTPLLISGLIVAGLNAAPAVADPPPGPGGIASVPKREVAKTYWCVASNGASVPVPAFSLCAPGHIKLECWEDAEQGQSICVQVRARGGS